MLFKPGQKYLSDTEPELGVGTITAVNAKRLYLSFSRSATQRIYTTDNPPIQRLRFNVGDTIIDTLERSYSVTTVEEIDGIIRYWSDTQVLDETQLSDHISISKPLDKIANNCFDDTRSFDFRYKVLALHTYRVGLSVRGLVGAKIELLPHQISIVDTVVSSNSIRFLLADEVGLGKTIEACLILHRLLLTGKIGRILIITPQYLKYQWFVELFRRFNLTSSVVDESYEATLKENAGNPFLSQSLVILSIEDLTRNELLFRSVVSAEWDLLIVDEAHHLTSTADEYTPISVLCKKIESVLLLTATPDVLDQQSFFSLMQLIDPVKYSSFDRFLLEHEHFTIIATIAEKILSNQNLSQVELQYLEKNTNLSVSSLNTDQTGLDPAQTRVAFVAKLIDYFGIGRSIFRNARFVIGTFAKRNAEIISLSETEPIRSGNDGTSLTNKGQSVNPIISLAVVEWIVGFIKEHMHEKTLIICSSKEKVFYLQKHVNRWKQSKFGFFHEDMSILQLDRMAAWFNEQDGASVLISSEIGSEGRNFTYADYLILADLPHDPEKLEQRIGRLDRIGRKKPVRIYIPVVQGSVDHMWAQWYSQGLNAFEKTLVGSFQIAQRFIPKIKAQLGQSQRSISSEIQQRFEKLIAETKIYAQDIASKILQGKNRLLQFSSCNSARASEIIAQINACDTNTRHQELLEEIFENLGITIDQLKQNLLNVRFDLLTEHTVPVPRNSEDGMTASFDRTTALAREDAQFLSLDHPMVIAGIESVIHSSKGNCSIVSMERNHHGFLVESIYVLEPAPCATRDVIQFFTPAIVRFVFNQKGEDVTESLSPEYLSHNTNNISKQAAKKLIKNNYADYATLVAKSNTKCELLLSHKQATANDMIDKEFEYEVQRLKQLSQYTESQVQSLYDQYDKLRMAIKASHIRLDSLRLIVTFCV